MEKKNILYKFIFLYSSNTHIDYVNRVKIEFYLKAVIVFYFAIFKCINLFT